MNKQVIAGLAITVLLFSIPSLAQESGFYTGRLVPALRDMVGKPLLEQALNFNNSTSFVLEKLAPEGASFFWGGNTKEPGENADDMRLKHRMIILLTPCTGVHDLSAKISSIAVWEELDHAQANRGGVNLEELLSLMNTPPGIVTPSTLRAPKVQSLRGPVFEYVRGDTTETLGFFNEGDPLRINWYTINTAVCPR